MRLLFLLFLLVILIVQAPTMASGPSLAAGHAKASCESQALTFDSKEIKCSLRASDDKQHFRLTVNFSGGHDDTSAAMTVSLNGEPLACEPGSKTRLMAEDGDVSLICLFSIAEGSARTFVLRSVVSWKHAEYTSFDLALI